MNRRPTIQLLDWKIALDLEATEKIQGCENVPAYNCKCEDCETWRRKYREALPENILKTLARLKINMDRPTDVYRFGRGYRVIYHCVGRVLSEPAVFKRDENGEDFHTYTILEKEPYLSIIVHKQSSLCYQDQPIYKKVGNSELIRIEFILDIGIKQNVSTQHQKNT